MTDKEIDETVAEYESKYGLPTMDVLKHGCEKIVSRLLEVFPELQLSQEHSSVMTTPRIEIDLEKIAHNATRLREIYASKGIGIIGVTKVVCGDPVIAEVLVNTGINTLADSRLQNIQRMRQAGIQAQFVLLRSPGAEPGRIGREIR